MSRQGHYEVTLVRGVTELARRTFPFGQFSEIGYWLDEVGLREDELVVIQSHDLHEPELHSVRSELHEIDRPDVGRAERLAAELAAELAEDNPSTGTED